MDNNDQHPNAPQGEVLPPEGKPEQQKAQGQAQPEAPPLTLAQAKALVCKKLSDLFTRPLMNERLLRMSGGDASRVAKNLTAFLSLITEHDGGSRDVNKKKYYHQCSLQSLTTCFLESMNMQLPFDSRKLVSIIIYDWEATLDISYKGFVNALNRHFANAFVECKLVFDADKFQAEIDGRVAKYTYKPADPFAVVDKDFKGIKGGYCYFSYTDTDGKMTSRLVFLSKAQILKNKSRALQTYVWDSDPKAMAEKTCIREGARLPFASIDLDTDIEEVDNRHYQLERPEGSDDLKLLIAAQQEVVHGKPDDEPKDKPLPSNEAVGDATKHNAGQAGEVTPAAQVSAQAQGETPIAATATGVQPMGKEDVAGVSQGSAPAVIENEPQPKNIDDAEFEEGKP